MASISRLTVPTGRLISVSPLLHSQFTFEPKKSFICNKLRFAADPNEPKEPNEKQRHRLASFRHSPIRIGVPSPASPQISSISWSVTATPFPRAPYGKPWTMISSPGSTQATRADQGVRPTR